MLVPHLTNWTLALWVASFQKDETHYGEAVVWRNPNAQESTNTSLRAVGIGPVSHNS